jgi:membrane protease subunit HflC
MVEVRDDQTAVVQDHLGSRARVDDTPGRKLFLPWFTEIEALDKRPLAYAFEGNAKAERTRAPQLLVRANDGSSFWFDRFSLRYALIPSEAARVLADSGRGERYQDVLVQAFARAVLRDEFGRFTAEEVIVPDNSTAATRAARERMNALLASHGVQVLEIDVAKPRFDHEYESAIERRKVAEQEIEHLRARGDELRQERLQRLARVRKEKEDERRTKESQLAIERLQAEQKAIRQRSEAEVYALMRSEAAKAMRAEREATAGALVERYTREAEGLAARALALAARGPEAVREAWIARLAEIEFTLIPYSHDGRPERVEYEQDK